MSTLEEKWKNDPKPFEPVKNENLTCRTCSKRTDKVSSCEIFDVKPLQVLKGGACIEYKQKKHRTN